MSWDILPKANLQYFLSKLKDKLDLKVDKETGKVLSDNNYTTTEKNKLAGIASGAEQNVQTDWNQNNTSADDYLKNKPTKLSEFTNDSGFVTTDEKVKQENTTGSADYRVLFSNGANDTTETKTARKSTNLKFNPSTGILSTLKLVLSKALNRLLTGTGTAGQDKGSGVANRYVPAEWKFNASLTPVDGDEITIKIPVAGISYGVWLSVDNGTTYYPVGINDTNRLGTHFANGTTLQLVFQTNANFSIYARGGADSSTTYTGNYWKVVNFYNTDTDTRIRFYRQNSGYNADYPLIASRTQASGIGTAGSNGSYSSIYGVMWDDTTKVPTLNPSTGEVKAVKFTGAFNGNVSGSSGSCTGNAATATKATKDSDGNAINTTYMKKGVDRVTAGKTSGSTLGSNATAEGSEVQSLANCGHAEGLGTQAGANADAVASHAEGNQTKAFLNGSHSEGVITTAYGAGAHAEGYATSAFGSNSHAEGESTTASGNDSHAEGYHTTASGTGAHAEGGYATAATFGYGTLALGLSSHSEGIATTAEGDWSHAEGYVTKAKGNGSHSEGGSTTASGNHSHSEGGSTIANASCSHSEGWLTKATGSYSHAEGGGYTYTSSGRTYTRYAIASGNYSHVEGIACTASGSYSHAEGSYCCAIADSSHAQGWGTKTGALYQTAIGHCNEGKTDTLFEIGYGESIGSPKNVFEVYQNGNIRAPYSDIISLQSGKCYLHKVGRSVTCYFCGLDSYTFRNGAGAVLIPDTYAEYRPYSSICGFSFIYKANSDIYMATLDLSNTGVLSVNYISSVASNGKMNRAAPGNTQHLVWGTMCWVTAS